MAAAEPFIQRLPPVSVDGLYVHVPFCFHKCHYCDFYSIVGQSDQRMERFVERILREGQRWTGTNGPVVRPRTVFLGGGTPTLLPMASMRRLIRGLRELYDFSELVEWTIEANPATVTTEYAEMLRQEGADRLSCGAQSFVPAELAVLERHHKPADVPASIEIARRAGFERLNIDLIYAIPGQDLGAWQRSLDEAIALGTEHVSCYALTYEENTPITAKKRLGVIRPADEHVEIAMMRHARRRLSEACLPPYEISNYARPGAECRHNLLYWNGGNYIGLGPSAASHLSGHRWKNRPRLGDWERAVDTDTIAATDVEQLSPLRRTGELAMLQLRLTRGIDFAGFLAATGHDPREIYGTTIATLRRAGLLEVDDAGLRLTQRGVELADGVAAEFLGGVE